MKEKRLVDANHFMQVLKNIEYALKGELTHGKIKTSVVQMIEGSLNAEPTIAPESLQPLTYNENRDYIDCDEFICHKCGIHVEDCTFAKDTPCAAVAAGQDSGSSRPEPFFGYRRSGCGCPCPTSFHKCGFSQLLLFSG